MKEPKHLPLYGSGLRITRHPGLVVRVPVYIRWRRTWRQRLFSLPWRPWVAIRVVEQEVVQPLPYLVGDGRGGLMGHPATVEKMLARIDRLAMEGARVNPDGRR